MKSHVCFPQTFCNGIFAVLKMQLVSTVVFIRKKVLAVIYLLSEKVGMSLWIVYQPRVVHNRF